MAQPATALAWRGDLSHRQSNRRLGTVALGASLALLLYAALSYAVRAPEPLARDLQLARWVQALRWRPFTWLLWWMSVLGFLPALPTIPVGTALWLWRAGQPLEALAALASASAGGVAVWLKRVTTRPRPDAQQVRVSSTLGDYGFPSGHVATYTAFCGFLAYLGYIHGRSWAERRLLPLACGLVIGLMGPSRIYRGHHWASDVLGGYILGLGHLVLVLGAYRSLRQAQGR